MSSIFSPNQALRHLHIGKPLNVPDVILPSQCQKGELIFFQSECLDTLSFLFPAVATSDSEILALPIGDDVFWKRLTEQGISLKDSEFRGINALHLGILRNLRIGFCEFPDIKFRGFYRPGFGSQIWLPGIETALFKEYVSWIGKEWYIGGNLYCLVRNFDISREIWESVSIYCKLGFLPEDIQYKERLIAGIFMIDWFTRYGASEDYAKNYIDQELKETLDYLRQSNMANAELLRRIETIYPLTEEKLAKFCSLLGLLPEEIEHVKKYWLKYTSSNYELEGKVVHIHFSPSLLTTFSVQVPANNIESSQWELKRHMVLQPKRAEELMRLMSKLGKCEKAVHVRHLQSLTDRLRLVCCALRGHNDIWETFTKTAREFKKQVK